MTENGLKYVLLIRLDEIYSQGMVESVFEQVGCSLGGWAYMCMCVLGKGGVESFFAQIVCLSFMHGGQAKRLTVTPFTLPRINRQARGGPTSHPHRLQMHLL